MHVVHAGLKINVFDNVFGPFRVAFVMEAELIAAEVTVLKLAGVDVTPRFHDVGNLGTGRGSAPCPDTYDGDVTFPFFRGTGAKDVQSPDTCGNVVLLKMQ